MTAGVSVENLTCAFPMESALWARLRGREQLVLKAINDVSLRVEPSTSVGIVGESGCGKSTLAKAILGLVEPVQGTVHLNDQVLTAKRDRRTRRRIQMVFQDPGASLNPKMTVGSAITGVIRFHQLRSGAEIETRVNELLELVELPSSVANVRPTTLSGGQRQRVAIARALALEPDVLIADEAVAALDVSVQASILNLLNDLRHRLGLTMLFISHDLAVVRQVTDRVVVLYLGRIVEDQPTADLFQSPHHPYTRALLAAAPRFGSKKKPGETALTGEVPSPVEQPPGCAFQSRCPLVEDICCTKRPPLDGPDEQHQTACHFALTPTEYHD